ncbi:hypothetical protein CGLO_15831 [Colletotrichum gloeosporioides Cg-14]|uniref:Peptidase C14 caspase domain-containing protein n=1 Tax=Colletotrichum gloeosporioides (strain Cg-14) TaxID=1237896 RepID=T0L199_COLGC|nr:hypothetical protein CGLO_15831 [Colletotrichum gloeosporioides Cg-14]
MSITKWALLCGIDYYFDGNARSVDGQTQTIPNLAGCVNDVQKIYEFLINLEVQPSNIGKLTATVSEKGLLEDESSLPTWLNVKRELNYIFQRAAPGDLVYFHYSGHGTRRDQQNDDYLHAGYDEDDEPLEGMALVMTDVLKGGAYLTGHHLGVWMRNMVREKGLRVTVVLDSCYSGLSFRDGSDDGIRLRTLKISNRTHQAWLKSDYEADAEIQALDSDLIGASGMRDAVAIQRPWLSNPEGCTVLTACGPSQTAGERLFDTLHHGVLTYWIVERLQDFIGAHLPSHQYVVNHATYKIQDMRRGDRSQTPMIFGDGQHEFLGTNTYFERPASYVISRTGDAVVLGVGAAQGVGKGALYDLTPGNQIDMSTKARSFVRAQVLTVDRFTSTAQLLDGNRDVASGWLAFLHQWALERTLYVALSPKDLPIRAVFGEHLRKTPGLDLADDSDSEAFFTVNISKDRTFQIFQEHKQLPRLPRITVGDRFAARKLACTISHVARYLSLRDLGLRSFQNDRCLPKNELSLEVTPSSVEEDDDVTAYITYTGTSKEGVWTSLFCFTPSWAIIKVEPLPTSGQTAYWTSQAQPLDPIPLYMTIPPKSDPEDPTCIEDVFVLFVSNGDGPAVAWDDICLPGLPIDSEYRWSEKPDPEVGNSFNIPKYLQ